MPTCPSCQAVTRKGANFCSYCGLSLPVVVGASFPYGIRFPMLGARLAYTLAASTSPRHSIDGDFCTALYDRATVNLLSDLHRVAFSTLPRHSILHTVDGGQLFFSGPSFWGCMSRRMDNAGVLEGEVEHWSARCHSFFGCLAAQKRQHAMYHREGWEVFYPGRHGRFDNSPAPTEDEPAPITDSGPLKFFFPDRAKIKAEVETLTRRAGCNRCPVFSAAYLNQQVKKIPLVIEVGVTPDCGRFRCQLHGEAVWWKVY